MRLLVLTLSFLALSEAGQVYPTKKIIHHRHRVYRHRHHQEDQNDHYVTYEDCCFDAVKGKNGSPPKSIRKHDCSSFMAPSPAPTTTTVTVTSGVTEYEYVAPVTAFHYPQPPEGCERIPRYAAEPCKCDPSKYSSACSKWGITTGTNDQPGETVTITITKPAAIYGGSYGFYTTIDSAQTTLEASSIPGQTAPSPPGETTIEISSSLEATSTAPIVHETTTEIPSSLEATSIVPETTTETSSSLEATSTASIVPETTTEIPSSLEATSIATTAAPTIPETTDLPSLEPSTILASDIIALSIEEPPATTTSTTTPTPKPHVPVSPLIRRCSNPLVCDNASSCSRGGDCLCQPSLRGEGFCLEDRPCSSLTTCQRDVDCEDGSVCMLTCCPEAKCLEMPWLCVFPNAPRRLFAKLARRGDVDGLRVVRRAVEGEVVLDTWTGHIVLDGKGGSGSGSSGFGL